MSFVRHSYLSFAFEFYYTQYNGSYCRLLHLRNTWGEFSWTGDWNEYSECWNQIPAEEKTRLATRGSSEGMFWICFDDWLK